MIAVGCRESDGLETHTLCAETRVVCPPVRQAHQWSELARQYHLETPVTNRDLGSDLNVSWSLCAGPKRPA